MSLLTELGDWSRVVMDKLIILAGSTFAGWCAINTHYLRKFYKRSLQILDVTSCMLSVSTADLISNKDDPKCEFIKKKLFAWRRKNYPKRNSRILSKYQIRSTWWGFPYEIFLADYARAQCTPVSNAIVERMFTAYRNF